MAGKTKRRSKPAPKKNGFKAVTPEVIPMPEQPGAGQPTLYRPEYCTLLIKHMEQGLSYATFVTKLPMNSSTGRFINIDTLYAWEKEHPEFSEAKKMGNQMRVEMYETFARNISMGMIPPPPEDSKASMTRGNAAMTMFMLRNLDPERYAPLFGPKGDHENPDAKEAVINFNVKRLEAPKEKK